MHTGNPYLDRNRALYAAVCTVHRYQFSDFSRDVYLSEKGYFERIQEEITDVKAEVSECKHCVEFAASRSGYNRLTEKIVKKITAIIR